MKHRATGPCTKVLALFLAFNGSACSLIFVKPPPSNTGQIVASSRKECTKSKLAPILDTLFTGLEVVRTVYALDADDSVYASPDQPLSRESDVALGIGFTTLFLGSAIYGYWATARCEGGGSSDGDHADAEAERWYDGDGRQATPARARPAPPRAAPVASTPSPAGVAAPTAQPPAPATGSEASTPSAPAPATEAPPAAEPSPAP